MGRDDVSTHGGLATIDLLEENSREEGSGRQVVKKEAARQCQGGDRERRSQASAFNLPRDDEATSDYRIPAAQVSFRARACEKTVLSGVTRLCPENVREGTGLGNCL